MLCVLVLLTGCGAPARPIMTAEQANENARKLVDHLSETLRLNFQGTSWYPLIERVEVSVDRSGTFSVNARTAIFPDGDAPRVAGNISAALMSWALTVEEKTPLKLQHLQVFGRRGDTEALLRSWSSLFGWKDH